MFEELETMLGAELFESFDYLRDFRTGKPPNRTNGRREKGTENICACPKCDYRLLWKWNYCPFCGQKLDWAIKKQKYCRITKEERRRYLLYGETQKDRKERRKRADPDFE